LALLPDGTIDLDAVVAIARADKFRGQHVRITLHIPVGHKVFLDPSVQDLLDDVPNLENTYDHDMVGLTWTMTESGLTQFPERVAPPTSSASGSWDNRGTKKVY
jgi:hypothetical protein